MLGVNVAKRRDDLLGEAIGQVFAFEIGAEIVERQHRQPGAQCTPLDWCSSDLYRRDEAVTALRNRFDVDDVRRAVSQRLADLRDAVSDGGLLNDAVGPQSTQHSVLLDEVSLILDQQQQEVERLWCQRDRLAVTCSNCLSSGSRENGPKTYA